MRGKVYPEMNEKIKDRITPACAGKSPRAGRSANPGEDHPRVCGEKEIKIQKERKKVGSPPRVRGKVPTSMSGKNCVRITPACAGKSTSRFQQFAISWDHPRVCGEKAELYSLSIPSMRITPACAGKRLKKAHKIKDFDPVPIRFHLVFRRFERWCSNLPTPDGNVPV